MFHSINAIYQNSISFSSETISLGSCLIFPLDKFKEHRHTPDISLFQSSTRPSSPEDANIVPVIFQLTRQTSDSCSDSVATNSVCSLSSLYILTLPSLHASAIKWYDLPKFGAQATSRIGHCTSRTPAFSQYLP